MLERLDKEPFAMEEIDEAMELVEQRLQEQVLIETCPSNFDTFPFLSS